MTTMYGLFVLFALTSLLYGCNGIRDIPAYMGCFTDSDDRLLDGASKRSDVMTPKACIDFCFSKNYHMAGVEYRRECYCGGDLKGTTRRSDEECNMPCAGDPTRICGAGMRLSIYRTGLELEPAIRVDRLVKSSEGPVAEESTCTVN